MIDAQFLDFPNKKIKLEPGSSPSLNFLFENRRSYNFSSEGEITDLLVGPFFSKPTFDQLAVSTSTGKVLIIVDGKIKALLNPKTGPISSLAAGALTKFGSIDLAVGDSSGQITVFSETQIVSKSSISHPVQSIAFIYDIVGNINILAGSSLGHLSCHHFHNRNWRTSLSFAPYMDLTNNESISSSNPITKIQTVCLRDGNSGAIAALTFVINNSKLVHVYSSSHLVNVIKFPSSIISFCKGNFFKSKPALMTLTSSHEDVLFASQSGEIFQIDELFKPTLYLKLGHSISQILPYRPKSLPSDSSDLLVVQGISNEAFFYLNQNQIHVLYLPDWISKIVTGDLLNDYNDSHYTPSSTHHLKVQPVSSVFISQGTKSSFHAVKDFLGPDIAFALNDSTIMIYSGLVFISN